MIRYTLVEAQSPTTLRVKPILAFQKYPSAQQKKYLSGYKYETVPNGIKTRMYDGYSHLYMQFSKSKVEYVHTPDWYDDFEYFHEERRGYESH
jgi:hypothetical protein